LVKILIATYKLNSLKGVKEPAPALSVQVAEEARNKSSRTKSYGLSQLFGPQWSDIAGFCVTVAKLLPYRHAAITG
jgi:hypothetical protein